MNMGALSVDFKHLTDDELLAIIANHKTLPAEYQRVCGYDNTR